MQTRVDEVAERIYRISTFVPDIAPSGFTFNQFLVEADEPLLFHCGMRALFPAVREAVERVLPVNTLRWISFGHVEADELGAMNAWLQVAPRAEVFHSTLGCAVSIADLADRPPRALKDGETLSLGNLRVRLLMTPHLPHNWEAVMLFEETTATLFSGDILTNVGNGPVRAGLELVERSLEADELFPHVTAVTPSLPSSLQRLAELRPKTIAVMHGSSFAGDGRRCLESLAGAYDEQLRRSPFEVTERESPPPM